MNVDILPDASMSVNMILMATRESRTAALEECCPSVLAAPLSGGEAAELAKGFAALADPVRLRLLSLIAAQATGEVCACELVEPLGKSQPTVSHHLKVLREAGLVEGDKRGTWVWYRVVPAMLDRLRDSLSGTVPAPT
jgi:ArsR family transcriptional regulator, arsenate/arsenite/antimonite-responsive transcriptional repressor